MRRDVSGSIRGVTLVELMFAAAILAVILMATHFMLFSAIQLSTISQEETMATFDMNAVISRVRTLPIDNLMDPTFQDEQGGARMPHGGVVPLSIYGAETSPGNYEANLNNEEIVIYYYDAGGARFPLPGDPADPLGTSNIDVSNGFQTPDPLVFDIECTWTNAGSTRSRLTRTVTCIRTR